MKQSMTQRQRGVSLLELALILVIIGLLLTLVTVVVPQLTDRTRLTTTSDITIEDVSDALVTFAARNGRLPCPDTTATPNGLEGSGGVSGCAGSDTVGLVPYRELGFSDPILDEASLPIRYAVYRNVNGGGDSDADLATLTNRFIPVLPGNDATVEFPDINFNDSPPTLSYDPTNDEDPDLLSEGFNFDRKMPDNQNDLDFCLALRNAKAAAASAGFVNTLDLGGASPASNSAFVLASGGVEDADNDAAFLAFDGVNETAALDFESPARRRNNTLASPATAYDDIVHAMPFNVLESKLSCPAITVAVSAAANIANAAAHQVVQTEDLLWVAEQNALGDDLAVTLADLSIAIASLQLAGGIADAIALPIQAACVISDAAGVPGAIAAAVAGAVAVGLSVYAKIVAEQQLDLNDAALLQAANDAVQTNDIAARICLDALNADQRGGQGNAPPTQPRPADRP